MTKHCFTVAVYNEAFALWCGESQYDNLEAAKADLKRLAEQGKKVKLLTTLSTYHSVRLAIDSLN